MDENLKPYQDYRVFQISHQLNLAVYAITDTFPRHEVFGLSSQMRRAASSIPMNIAEGSVKSEREFRQALRVALGSAAELEYQFLMAKDLSYMPVARFEVLTQHVVMVKKMLHAFIRSIDDAASRAEDQRPTTNDQSGFRV